MKLKQKTPSLKEHIKKFTTLWWIGSLIYLSSIFFVIFTNGITAVIALQFFTLSIILFMIDGNIRMKKEGKFKPKKEKQSNTEKAFTYIYWVMLALLLLLPSIIFFTNKASNMKWPFFALILILVVWQVQTQLYR